MRSLLPLSVFISASTGMLTSKVVMRHCIKVVPVIQRDEVTTGMINATSPIVPSRVQLYQIEKKPVVSFFTSSIKKNYKITNKKIEELYQKISEKKITTNNNSVLYIIFILM